jgi:glycosyltransferase involved in cell wall biosynthesis
MKLVVVIPALNEAVTIAGVIEKVPRDIPGLDQVLVIVVDDGSTDETAAVSRQAGARVISFEANRGNGAAVATGLEAALRDGADFVVTIDADGQFNPDDIRRLVVPLLEGRSEFVTCTRFADKKTIPKMPKVKIWGNAAVTALTNLIAGTRLTDASCGFRAYTRDAALKMNVFSEFDYAQEGLVSLAARGVRISEISLPVRGVREFGDSRIASNLFKFGSKCLSTLLRVMRDFRPLLFFGSIGVMFLLVGVVLGAWVLIHWIMTGETKPYTSFLTGSAVGLLVGVVLFVLALIADLLGRVRRILEQILFLCKGASYDAAQRDARLTRMFRAESQPNETTHASHPAPEERAAV